MVGSRGKGSRSKNKGPAPGPAGCEPLKICSDESSDGPSDGEDGKNDIADRNVISSVEEKNEMISGSVASDGQEEKGQYADGPLDGEDGKNDITDRNVILLVEEKNEIISGSVGSDGQEEKGQYAHKVGDGEKDVVTEIIVDRAEDFCAPEGTIEDVKDLSYGGNAATSISIENIEEVITEKEPEEDEAIMMFALEDKDASPGNEKKSSEAITEGVANNNIGLASDLEIMENVMDNLENHKDSNKIDAEEPVGTVSGMDEEEPIEGNASVTNEVEEASEKVNTKRKLVKKKVVKKKMVRRRAAAVNEEMTQPSDENHASGEVCKVDTNGHVNWVSDVENASDEACKADQKEQVDDEEKAVVKLSDLNDGEKAEVKTSHVNDEEKEEVKPFLKVNKKRIRIRKKKGPQGQLGTATAQTGKKEQADKVDKAEEKASDVNDEEKAEVKASDINDEEKAEVKPSVKVNKKQIRIRKKKVPKGQPGTATAKDAQKPQSRNDESGSKLHIEINEQGLKREEMDKAGDRVTHLKSCKKNTMANRGSKEVVPKDVVKPKPSKEGKSSKKIDSMGMIFMCNSETKKDCYRYNVLGLPAGKKDMVSKVYKGMRLFLFDIDLRMMYGIYKAAGPGGYNIEPRAFKSQYPSQVRFAVLEDCVPLAEERFKKVLKDIYYTKNKFNCQLNSEQVKNLCMLFHETNKKAESKKVRSSRKAAAVSSALQDKKRKRVDDRHRGAAVVRSEQERSRRRTREEVRHVPLVIDERYHGRPVYERETYVSSVAPALIYQPLTVPSPPCTRTYSFDRAAGVDPYRRGTSIVDPFRRVTLAVDPYGRDTSAVHPYRRDTSAVDPYRRDILAVDPYRRDTSAVDPYRMDTLGVDPYRRDTLGVDPYRRDLVLDHRDLGPSNSRDSRLPIDHGRHDTYVSYGEPRAHDGLVYGTDTRREHYDYSSGTRREHYDYTSDGWNVEHHRPAEYRPALPLYRRY